MKLGKPPRIRDPRGFPVGRVRPNADRRSLRTSLDRTLPMEDLRHLLWLRLLVVLGPGVMLFWSYFGLPQPQPQPQPLWPIALLDVLLERTRNRWQLLRPWVPLRVHCAGPPPAIPAPHTVGQTLISLLDNAADACPDGVDVAGHWDARRAITEIRDRGPGPAGGSGQPARQGLFLHQGWRHRHRFAAG